MKHSFTLIELLIVIVIIGILASVAIQQYQKVINRTYGVEAMQTLRALDDAAQRYFCETGAFLKTSQGAPLNGDSLFGAFGLTMPSNAKFTYSYDSDGTTNYVIEANLAYPKDDFIGAITSYYILVDMNPATPANRQAVGNGFYRSYCKSIRTSQTTSIEEFHW